MNKECKPFERMGHGEIMAYPVLIADEIIKFVKG